MLLFELYSRPSLHEPFTGGSDGLRAQPEEAFRAEVPDMFGGVVHGQREGLNGGYPFTTL